MRVHCRTPIIMLAVRSSRRRHRTVSVQEHQYQEQDHNKKPLSPDTSPGALASRGRRAKSEVSVKRQKRPITDTTNNTVPSDPPRLEPSMLQVPSRTTSSNSKQRSESPASSSTSKLNVKHKKHKSVAGTPVTSATAEDVKPVTTGKRVIWHRRSASTGSSAEKNVNSNVVLSVPSCTTLTRARSDDRLHDLCSVPEQHWPHLSILEQHHVTTSASAQQLGGGGSIATTDANTTQRHDGAGSTGSPPRSSRNHQQRNVAELFARQMLQYSYPLVTPPPILVVEDQASGDETAAFGAEGRSCRRSGSTSRLNGSSSSNLGAKSAPPTPHGERLQPGSTFPPPQQLQQQQQQQQQSPVSPSPAASTASAASSTAPSPVQPTRSPSHIFSRHDRQALKQLSSSTPAMTQAPPGAPAAEPDLVVTPPGSSKARQKKFHRHFKQVAAEERVLNYYSCALVSDILLQGHLYITKNYFAFYSNVFGYVTKLLIPTASVIKVTKEKTAKIIPNAVGVATVDDKHVFGSLLSRDATFKLMMQVWNTAMELEALAAESPAQPQVEPTEMKDTASQASADLIIDDEDSSLSGSGNDDSAVERSLSPTPIDTPTDINLLESKGVSSSSSLPPLVQSVPDGPSSGVANSKFTGHIPTTVNGSVVPIQSLQSHIRNSYRSVQSMPRPTLLLLVATGLLVVLFISAAVLLHRISAIQSQFISNPILSSSGEVYQEILKWQMQLHSKSSSEVQQFLNANLDQIAKVRQSLEALSLLLVSEDDMRQRYQSSGAGGFPGGSAGSFQQSDGLPRDRAS